jgi:hypothetical protein
VERLPTSRTGWSRARRTGCACVRYTSLARLRDARAVAQTGRRGKAAAVRGTKPRGRDEETARNLRRGRRPQYAHRGEKCWPKPTRARAGTTHDAMRRTETRRTTRPPSRTVRTVARRRAGKRPAEAEATNGDKACALDDPGASSRPDKDPECPKRGAEKDRRGVDTCGYNEAPGGDPRNRARERPRAGRTTSEAQANDGLGNSAKAPAATKGAPPCAEHPA